MAMETGFETEAYKLMISDITRAEPYDEGSFRLTLSASQLTKRSNKSLLLDVKMIWIQGTVTRLTHQDGENVLFVSDGTAQAKILNYDVVPGGDHPNIAAGSYIGILGQIIMSKPSVEIKAVKLMCLHQKPYLETMWDEEVKDLKAFLLGLTDPVL